MENISHMIITFAHTKDHHKRYKLHPCIGPMRKGRNLSVQPDCLKGRIVYGTVYGDMYLKDPLGSIATVGYCIPVLDFYLVLHGLCCRKSAIIDESFNTVSGWLSG